MYAFGMLGSYFSQGVYAVAGPFQGAVDIIVVQQRDGTFKSSPWYVKCGDFQGVLKRREKIVEISVNGVKSDFYMLLNNRGEAYFEKEVEDAILALPSTSSSGGGDISESETSSTSHMPQVQETAGNQHEGLSISKVEAMSEPLQVLDMDTPTLLGSSPGNGTYKVRSPPDNSCQAGLSEHRKSPSTVPGNTASGNTSEQGEANIPALLTSSSDRPDHSLEQGDANLPALVTSSSVKCLYEQVIEDSTENDNGSSARCTLEQGEANMPALLTLSSDRPDHSLEQGDANLPALVTSSSDKLLYEQVKEDSTQNDNGSSARYALDKADSVESTEIDASEPQEAPVLNVNPTVINVNGANLILAETDSSFLRELIGNDRSASTQNVLAGILPEEVAKTADPGTDSADMDALGSDEMVPCNLKTVITEDWFGLERATGLESGDESSSTVAKSESSDTKALDELIWDDYKIVTAEEERQLHDALNKASVLGMHIDDERWTADTGSKDTELVNSSVWVSDALASDATSSVAISVADDNTLVHDSDGVGIMKGDKDVVCKVEECPSTKGNIAGEIPTIPVVPPPSRWSMWPLSFRKSRPETAPSLYPGVQKQALLAATKIAVGSPLTEEILRKNGYYEWPQKPKLRSYVPTTEQIESLKLKEGPNKVTFTFPRVLGRTQLDANIFLWKWNTRIVISDVDGTITKSDVLGQVMPLVGRDWTQSGVTRLFSAIKENGYEVLFLSARAISQAYLTRQFLVNLKQDGENLPEGPVFISPDGLIPSLYREVVRRAPHEFKISCLEGIRKLFPSDVNPFYAGFGNRVTDEISYAKVGIPKGKIFTINPKGQVMVNHHVHVKSYTSIHSLVDDMFPPVYSSEQEDFNSWNFWKLPLPEIEDELIAPKSSKTKKGGNLKK